MPGDDLESVLRENYSLIRAVCWRILEDDSDADDAAQNALVSIARSYASFDGRSALSTWIYRIATNAALDELRRRRRRRLRTTPLENHHESTNGVTDPRSHEALASFEERDVLAMALARVPDEFRVPLVLRDVSDLEYDDIASILNIPPGTVRSRISRGRSRLASEWNQLQGNSHDPDQRPTEDDDAHRGNLP
jgi:RNA polymerase sigma-70 factor (ECF subfamily)